MTTVGEVLQTALEMERQGHQFYLDAERKVADRVVASVLRALAHDEDEHARVIRQFYQALQRSEGWPSVETDRPPAPARQRIGEIMAETAATIGADATFISTYETARALEAKSHDFYASQAEAAQDEALRKFLRFLAAVEQTHLDVLAFLVEATREGAERS